MSLDEQRQLFGPYDRHVKQLSKVYGVRLSAREGTLRLQGSGEDVMTLAGRVEEVLARVRAGEELSPNAVEALLLGRMSESRWPGEALAETALAKGEPLQARTPAQQHYLEAMEHDELVLACGPAGTGKTFLAVAAAVRQLNQGRVRRLVLVRPAVEAGEHLGFLPGDFEAKVNPYLRPLYDSLHDLIGPAGLRRLKSLDIVEIAPLAFMRGRTLNHSFIILDEAQNATPPQMKMFLTRLGEASRAVVTGDLTQTDLPSGTSGLDDAVARLRGVSGVSIVEFTKADIQRSPLVQRIVEAYGAEG